MPKSPEQFNFSLQRDREKFDKLPSGEKDIVVLANKILKLDFSMYFNDIGKNLITVEVKNLSTGETKKETLSTLLEGIKKRIAEKKKK